MPQQSIPNNLESKSGERIKPFGAERIILPRKEKEVEEEKKLEKEPEIKKVKVEEIRKEKPLRVTPSQVRAGIPRRTIGPLQKQVEDILAEDLSDIYQKLSPDQKDAFKIEGETVAAKITQLIQQTKIKIRQIWRLIRDWLKSLPAINKFFLEQEAKIKTDRIISLAQRQKK